MKHKIAKIVAYITMIATVLSPVTWFALSERGQLVAAKIVEIMWLLVLALMCLDEEGGE